MIDMYMKLAEAWNRWRSMDAMLTALSGHLEQLERRKQALLAELSALPGERAARRAEAGSWSMLEVAEHLMKVEDAMLEGAERQRGTLRRPVSMPETIRALIVRAVMRTPLRVKTPATATRVLPRQQMTMDELATAWSDVRERMAKFAEGVAESEAKVALFRHPISGGMTTEQGLAFLDAHFVHHEYQLGRLRRE